MQNYTVTRGSDFDLDMTFELSDAAQDITDWTITLRIKRLKELADDYDDVDGEVLIKEVDITDGPSGTATASLSAEETAALSGTYFYDVKTVDENGEVKFPMQGVITFSEAA